MVIRDSPLHGRGAFLTAAVKKGTYLGEYTGDLIGPEEADRRDDAMGADTVYLFDMDNTANGSHLMIDARTKGNKTRYINEDSNGTANCFFHVKVALGEYRCGVYAARDIAANEELLVSYGAKFSASRNKARKIVYIINRNIYILAKNLS
ncbi:uncharacterized protein EV422DRAFT_571472 [Fimicolochytrium jonesii]|uniref:uncharacterized protein n=1 Tax=Fimicolochytrium jonesii TaxID=1396493 RepID=UPI0022FEC5EB|nr:uncharacterized protein EV422DRAFT_571472 [Fimicolochytrium jonesii]KAI8816716.1 hypothetical protein EV422DRAFT_571472 [Fimicolochytrium jonesii]